MMIEDIIVKGVFATHCYFYIDDKSKRGFIIDPGAQGMRLLNHIYARGWKIEKILLTHGHFDHTGAVDELRSALNVPVMIHSNGPEYLMKPEMNLSCFCGPAKTVSGAECFEDGDWICLKSDAQFGLRVIHTPGHTEDSCLLYSERDRFAFSGDTIFRESIGNTSYPGGNREKILASIREKVLTLPDDVSLYSGHSAVTTVAHEKQFWRGR